MKANSILIGGIIALSAALWAAPAEAKCPECGTVVELKTVKVEGQGSGAGAVAGAVVGGVLGHQVGKGRGKDAATAVGAVGGAYAGHQIEKKSNEKMQYKVMVKMEGGNIRTFNFNNETAYRVGDKIKVLDGKLVRQ
jgi:outer membrane lipoprotein SlyB